MNVNREAIAQKAYELWEARGRPEGSPAVDWYAAERLLGSSTGALPAQSTIDESSAESFPASDPTASHLPDLPPANAADKWQASRKPSQT